MKQQKKEPHFPYYEEINDFLESITSKRTSTPLYYCFRLKGKVNAVKYKPPYRKGFYTILLVINASTYKINYNNRAAETHRSFLIFQSPGQLISYRFKPGASTKGYLICFKAEFFSFLKKSYLNDFSYLNMLQTEVFSLENDNLSIVQKSFEDLFSTYEKKGKSYEKVSSLKLILLQYLLKDLIVSDAKGTGEKVLQGKGSEMIFQKFLQLVEIHYIDKRTVNEYADLLSVTPSYLSSQIKKSSTKGALHFINNRVVSEAKSFLQYTESNINEVAQKLNFSDTSNFVKFFKKHTGKTPVEFKKENFAELLD